MVADIITHTRKPNHALRAAELDSYPRNPRSCPNTFFLRVGNHVSATKKDQMIGYHLRLLSQLN